MPVTGVHVIGEDVAGDSIIARAGALPAETAEAQRIVAEQGRTRIQGRAPYAGTPPFVYRDSWEIEVKVASGVSSVALFTSVPYARRIDEEGYHAADRLGRVYDVTGKAIVAPATEGLETELEAALSRIDI